MSLEAVSRCWPQDPVFCGKHLHTGLREWVPAVRSAGQSCLLGPGSLETGLEEAAPGVVLKAP